MASIIKRWNERHGSFSTNRDIVAAVEHGSIAAAGRALELSPAMAGKYLSALESALATRLLHRSTRALSLTDAGQQYLAASKRIMEALAEADAEAREGRSQLAGEIRLGVPRAFGTQKLAPMLTAFCRAHPQITLNLHTDERYADLIDGRLDLAVRIGTLSDSALYTRPLGSVRMGLGCAPGLLGAHERQNVSLIRRLPRLVFTAARSPGDWMVSNSDNRAYAIDGPTAMRSDDITLLVRAATEGLGIVYAPMFALDEPLDDGRLIQVLADHQTTRLDLQIVYTDRHHQPARVRALIDHLAACFQETRT
ncbi:LysR family transcriptional regulator [Chromohalobacter sp. HP20-39]|uniref:LysR family transcriptional regulator n=1 Tax=Chromohalobacter sp. HP20-39 TaxID=3079306 RepID=UPI00294B0610|nr:LysR family transcriptional regulator [Chromohalobacter sp. HP20-39]MDV6319623.1 LysR family transcriptional regulator [Chromohalobacter sp. HP20-39]